VGEADGRLHVREVEEAVGQLDVESQAAAPAGRSHGLARGGGVWLPPSPSVGGSFGKPTEHPATLQESLSQGGGHSPVVDEEVVLVTPQDLPDVGFLGLRLQDGDARRGMALQLPEHGAGQRCLLVDDHVADVDRALPGQPLLQAPEAAGKEALGGGVPGWRGGRHVVRQDGGLGLG